LQGRRHVVEYSSIVLFRETCENVQVCGAALCETVDDGQGKKITEMLIQTI